ncbi:hypothetical protein GQR58_014009 [Nymphon striatum]|nr:hypothetical protein GQR58_014009 [Nymphon striatum]
MSHKTVDLDGRPLLSSGPVRADDDNDDNDLDNNRKTEYRSAFLRQLRDMLNMKQSTLGHKDMQMTRIINDEADVQALVTMLESNWINPFDENSQELVSISSGKLATPDITEDLLHAHESGKKAYNAFKTERLEQEPPVRKFHDPMKKLNLKTFSNLSVKKMKTTAHGKELVLKADRNLFAHMLLVAQNRKLKMEESSHTYLGRSIKDVQRLRRGSSTGTSFKNIAPGHKLHQWRKFLANSNNKECLVTFLVKEWQEEKHRKKLNDKSLFVTRGKLCYHVTSSGTQIASDLESTQEEADIRMLLHAAHASRSDYEAIVVVSDDTDVLVLCLAFKPPISTNMYVKCGTKTRVKYADITKVFNALGYELSQALIYVNYRHAQIKQSEQTTQHKKWMILTVSENRCENLPGEVGQIGQKTAPGSWTISNGHEFHILFIAQPTKIASKMNLLIKIDFKSDSFCACQAKKENKLRRGGEVGY